MCVFHKLLNNLGLLWPRLEVQLLFHSRAECDRRHASPTRSNGLGLPQIECTGHPDCSFRTVRVDGGAKFPRASAWNCRQVRVRARKSAFELRGWEGEYVVSGEYVELSDKSVKSKAKLEPGYKIVFRYHGKDGVVEVTYERRLSAPNNETLS